MKYLKWNCPLCGENDFEEIAVRAYWHSIPPPIIHIPKPFVSFRCKNCDYILLFAPDGKKRQSNEQQLPKQESKNLELKPIQIELSDDD